MSTDPDELTQAPAGDPEVDPDGLEAVLRHIKDQRGFDFTGYQRASLARRVRRRMEEVGVDGYEDYLDHLTAHPDEFTQLFNTVLINVTGFFRDPDAWQFLREDLLPGLLQRREGQPIRVWIAGCASGEEAYTIAMVLAELLGVDDFRERVKIYATDIDEEALAQARMGTYDERALAAVPADLRERYFERVGSRFVFHRGLRRSVIFGRNDLVQDAPISQVDLLSCRNTLMYLNAETQARVLNRMHFALRPDGVLFLGKAEMLLSHAAYFRPIELKQRFFAKIVTEAEPADRQSLMAAPDAPAEPDRGLAELRDAAMMSSAAAQIVVDTTGRLTVANHRAMHLFGLSDRDLGRPLQDLDVSYRPIDLRGHIEEAATQRRSAWVRDVDLLRGVGDPLTLDIQVVPLADDAGSPLGVTVLFTDVTETRRLQAELLHANRQLETAYEELQSTNRELATINEELQSTVAELETTNEELQGTNQEAATMNEQLQSMNDRLRFRTAPLREHQAEVDRLNGFLAAVLDSTSSGIAVVAPDLRILAWNPRAADLWGVRADDAIGRHLPDLDVGLPVERLRQPLRQQLSDPGGGPQSLLLDAVDHLGRRVQVRVTLTRISDDGDQGPAALLLMDVVEETGAG